MNEAVSDRERERQELLREMSDNVGVAAFAYFPREDEVMYQSQVNKPIHWPGWPRPIQGEVDIDGKVIGTIVF